MVWVSISDPKIRLLRFNSNNHDSKKNTFIRCAFESFEKNVTTSTNSGNYTVNTTSNLAHSGDQSIKLLGGGYKEIDMPIKFTSQIANDELIVKFWASNSPAYQAPATAADPADKVGLKAYGSIFYALSVGTLTLGGGQLISTSSNLVTVT